MLWKLVVSKLVTASSDLEFWEVIFRVSDSKYFSTVVLIVDIENKQRTKRTKNCTTKTTLGKSSSSN